MQELDFEKIGARLKELRLTKGYTQEQVAAIIDVNTSHISNIENNRVKVSLTALVQLCNALDVTVDYVLSGEYPQNSSVLDYEILKELQKCTPDTKEKILKIVRVLQQP